MNGLTLLFSNAKATDVFIDQIISVLDRLHADGINLDIEGVSVADKKAFVDWLDKITDALRARGLVVTVDVPMGADAYDLKTISAISDALVLMAYDQHFETGQPGSIAGQDWFDDGLEDALNKHSTRKIDRWHRAYGYDWTDGKTIAKPIGFYDATQLAARVGAQIETDFKAKNSRFAYQDENGNSVTRSGCSMRSRRGTRLLGCAEAGRGVSQSGGTLGPKSRLCGPSSEPAPYPRSIHKRLR